PSSGTFGTALRTFLAPNPTFGDQFGAAVASIGTTIAVGAPGDDGAGADAGAVYVFDVATGALLRTVPGVPRAPGARFGAALATVGGDLLVGAPGDGSVLSGAASLFDGGPGDFLRQLPSPASAAGDLFGFSVAEA